ncbi:MAG: hypothetical protein LBS88_05080 [Tannerellaceae bacterium]|jgi:hypothetical protein|nr:hypothetical protein [Tannerellaceae bacterium]
MTLKEFSDEVIVLRNATQRHYSGHLFIYFKHDLSDAFVDPLLRAKKAGDFDYVIPAASYQNGHYTKIDFFGFYNSSYEVCDLIFELPSGHKWELLDISYSDCYYSSLDFKVKNKEAGIIKNVFCKGYFIHNFNEVLIQLKKEIEGQKERNTHFHTL